MVDEGARRAHALFVEALGMEGPGREAFLRSACQGDAPLREKLDRLIAAAAESTDFLETPALRQGAHEAACLLAANAAPAVSVRGYRVVRVIAAGGMAVVYEAMQEQPHRRVALKVMNRALTHTSAVRRFRFETEVLARLRHPGVAQIFDAGTCDVGQGHPVPFFAMEFIDGARTLIDHAQREHLPLGDRISKFAEVCDAVQHGHQHGVIHRDLKPGNILVGSDGRAKVIDFGVARSMDAEQGGITRRADLGQLIGTLNYMSPEQCSAGDQVDIRADVYSLGVILYELVTGRTPFDLGRVPIPEAVRVITQESPRRPSSLAPASRGDLEAIIGTAMEKDPARRYPSAGAIADDLRRYLSHQPIAACAPTVLHHARLFARRHRALAVAGLVVACVLVGAGVLGAASAARIARESRARLLAEEQALLQRDAARRTAYVASVGGAMSSSQTNDFAQARSRLALAPPELRNWEWSFVSAIVEQGEQIIQAHGDMVFGFALSADGRRLASGSRDGSVALWDAASGALLQRFDGLVDSAVNSVDFSRDGRFLVAGCGDKSVHVLETATRRDTVFRGHSASVESVSCGPQNIVASASSSGTLRLWKADTGDEVRVVTDQPGGIRGVRFSPDGSRLITWNRAGSVWIRGADAATVCQRLMFDGRAECAVLSPDGGMLAVGGSGGRITLFDPETGEIKRDFTTAPSNSTVRTLAFSPDGQWLISGQTDRTITLWHAATGARRSQLLGHTEAVAALAVNAAGDHLYSASWDRTIRIWCVDEIADGFPVQTFEGHTDDVLATAISPDGTLIASGGADRSVCMWDMRHGSLLAALKGHQGAVHGLTFSPDGARLASAATDGFIRLWSPRTGECTAIDPRAGPLWSVAFSPDQQLLASAGDDGVIRLWRLEDNQLVRSLPGHDKRVTCVAFSPDGATLASASRDGTVRTWDVASGKQLHRMPGHSLDVHAVVFSHDGRHLYSGSRDQTVRIWTVATGECLLPVLTSEGHLISCLSLNADGSRLAAGSWFGEIIIWDTAAREVAFSFRGQQNAIRSIAFSPDGRSLLCGGHDMTLRLYDAIPRIERVALRERAIKLHQAAQEVIDRLSTTRPAVSALADAIQREQIDSELLPSVWKCLLRRAASTAGP